MTVPVAVGSVIAERYRVDSIIGEGAMGVVVRATHLVLQQWVAIKFLRREAMSDADAVSRFVREARAAAKVQSEHVVRVQDVAALADGTPYIVMEYLDGSDLGRVLAERGPLPVGEAVRYILQICGALGETHAAGIVHGDLKPENVFIARSSEGRGRAKLLDFGISRIAFEEKTPRHRPLMGTPVYMAPEQFASAAIGVASDLWALGAVLYEMLSGAQAFYAPTQDEVRARVLNEAPAPIARPDVPPALTAIVARCLQKNPMDRFGSAAELAMALEPFVGPESPRHDSIPPRHSIPPTGGQRFVPTVLVPREKRMSKAWAFVGVLGAVVAVAGVAFVTKMQLERAAQPTDVPDSPEAVPVRAEPAAALVAPASAPAVPAAIESATQPAAAEGAGSPTARRSRARGPKPVATGSARPQANTAVTPAVAPENAAPEADRFGTRK